MGTRERRSIHETKSLGWDAWSSWCNWRCALRTNTIGLTIGDAHCTSNFITYYFPSLLHVSFLVQGNSIISNGTRATDCLLAFTNSFRIFSLFSTILMVRRVATSKSIHIQIFQCKSTVNHGYSHLVKWSFSIQR